MTMMEKSLENQFNAPAGGGGASYNANAGARAARRKGQVVEYSALENEIFEKGPDGKVGLFEKTDENGKVELDQYNNPVLERRILEGAPANLVEDFFRMEDFMAEIDADPASYDAVQNFGLAPITKLGEMAKKQIGIQQNFAGSLNKMRQAQDAMHQSGFDAFLEAGKAALVASGKAAGKGVGLITKMLNAIGKAGQKKEEKTEEQLQREKMQAELPRMAQKMEELISGIASCEEGLKQVLAEAAELGQARNTCARELALVIGCKNEVIRRYNEWYIPDAQANYAETNDMGDKAILDATINEQNHFLQRMASLVGQKALADVGTQEMQSAILTMQQQRTEILNIVQNSQPHWYSMLSAMGFASSMLEAAGMIQDSNDFSNNLHKTNQDMLGKVHEMTQQAQLQGVVDYKLIIESAEKYKLQIESGAKTLQEQNRQLEAQINEMSAANNNMLEAAEKAQVAQATLDSAKKPAAPAATVAPTTSNDNGANAAPATSATKKAGRGPRT